VPDPAFWSGRRVWLTGHTGFKGAWLACWLQALGAEVHGFSARPPTEPSLYELADVAEGMAGDVRGDVRSKSEARAAVARARPEVVIHMAAQALVRHGLEKPTETFAINVTGTAKVLDAVRREAAPRAVLVVTSDKCYRPSSRPRREHDPLGGEDPYSASKAAQEHVATAFRGFGLRIATARAGNAIGGGDFAVDRLIPDTVRALGSGEPLRVRAPEAVRPWQHVLAPLDGYLTLLERLYDDPSAATAWNFGPPDADARPVGWVVERLQARWPALRVEPAPPGAADGEAAVLRLDAGRARAELGWAPHWTLDQAIDATLAWYAGYREGADLRAATIRQIEGYGKGQE
jgi:CDP-glucose 4,6-dehydratase